MTISSINGINTQLINVGQKSPKVRPAVIKNLAAGSAMLLALSGCATMGSSAGSLEPKLLESEEKLFNAFGLLDPIVEYANDDSLEITSQKTAAPLKGYSFERFGTLNEHDVVSISEEKNTVTLSNAYTDMQNKRSIKLGTVDLVESWWNPKFVEANPPSTLEYVPQSDGTVKRISHSQYGDTFSILKKGDKQGSVLCYDSKGRLIENWTNFKVKLDSALSDSSKSALKALRKLVR